MIFYTLAKSFSMKKYIILLILALSFSCSEQKEMVSYTPISQKEFLESPFGFDEKIDNFKSSELPKYKLQKYLRKNKHYPEKTDTIFKFYYKKSEVFFYKSYMGNEFLLAGKILNKQIMLKNDIRTGISKESFLSKFSDSPSFVKDSVALISDGTKYTFIFEKDKLKRINIDNYFD